MNRHNAGKTKHAPVQHQPVRRLREQRQRRRRVLHIAGIIGFVVAIWGLQRLSYAESMAVQDIVVKGAARVEEKWIAVDADTVMKKPFLFAFSRHNRLLVPEHEIEQKVLERHEISSAEADMDDGILTISVVERAPVAIACDTTARCYDMDDFGMLFANATGDRLRIEAFDGSDVRLGGKILDRESIAELRALIETVKIYGVRVAKVRLDSPDEFTLYPQTGASIRGAWRTVHDAPAALQIVISAGTISTSTFASAEYIDLRFKDSVYVK